MRVTVKKDPEPKREWEVRAGLVFDFKGEVYVVTGSPSELRLLEVGHSPADVRVGDSVCAPNLQTCLGDPYRPHTPLGYLEEITLHVTDNPNQD